MLCSDTYFFFFKIEAYIKGEVLLTKIKAFKTGIITFFYFYLNKPHMPTTQAYDHAGPNTSYIKDVHNKQLG